MKKNIFFFFLIYSSLFSQTNYFVSSDGTKNFKTIKEVNAAPLKSGDIVSFSGDQQFSDASLICKTGVIYNSFGSGKATIGNASGAISSGSTIEINTQNVTLDNLKILGYREAYSVISFSQNNLTIKNCEIMGGQNAHDKWSYGIMQTAGSVSNIKIQNNVIHGFGGSGIYWSRPYNFDVSYNEIYDLWRTGAIVNEGAQAIQRATITDGKNPEDVWDCAYTVNVHHNNIHDFEMAAFMGYSRIIFEYNEIHHNLDERIYRGGVKHGSIGKLWDNLGTSDNETSLGVLGVIFRYNYVHDLKRFGQANYTYDKSTDYHRNNGIVPNVLSTNNGQNHPIYLSSGLAIYSNGMLSEYADDFNKDGEPDFIGNPDYVLSGLGYGNYWIHNNIFYNCSNQISGRSYNYQSEYKANLGSYFINNTIINCGWQSHITDDNGLMITQANSQSPHTVANNIIDSTSRTARYAGRWREKDLYLGQNIYLKQKGTITSILPSPGEKYAAQFEFEAAGSSAIDEQYLIGEKSIWNNSSSFILAQNLGITGVNIPDLRINPNSSAYNKGKSFSSMGDNFTVKASHWSESHSLGQDPTGRSFAYDILGNLRSTNDIGALGTDGGSTVVPPPPPPPDNSVAPVIKNQSTNGLADLGKDLSITITAECADPIGYQWWKSPYVSESESKITDNTKYSGSTTNALLIKNISQDDAKVKYVCEVYNTKNHSTLFVNSAPISVSLSLSNSSNSAPIVNGFKVYLEALYKENLMSSTLYNSKVFPLKQPYSVAPWKLNDDATIKEVKPNYVAWLFVELRDNLTNISYRKSGLLTNDGTIINTDETPFSFSNVANGNYYITIHHRNHLSIMSSAKVEIKSGEKINYDFTNSMASAYGNNSLADFGDGKFGMISGDTDANGVVNNLDFGVVANNIPFKGYAQGDLDMNGIINVLDYSLINKNILKRSNLP